MPKELCKGCGMGKLCEEEHSEGRLTVYCLEGCFGA